MIEGKYPVYVLRTDKAPQADIDLYVVGLLRDAETFIPNSTHDSLEKASALCSIMNAVLVLENYNQTMRPLIDPVLKHPTAKKFITELEDQRMRWGQR